MNLLLVCDPLQEFWQCAERPVSVRLPALYQLNAPFFTRHRSAKTKVGGSFGHPGIRGVA